MGENMQAFITSMVITAIASSILGITIVIIARLLDKWERERREL